MESLEEFNEKYKNHITNLGLYVNNIHIIRYLDRYFSEIIETKSNFRFATIRLKNNGIKIYNCNLIPDEISYLEKKLSDIYIKTTHTSKLKMFYYSSFSEMMQA